VPWVRGKYHQRFLNAKRNFNAGQRHTGADQPADTGVSPGVVQKSTRGVWFDEEFLGHETRRTFAGRNYGTDLTQIDGTKKRAAKPRVSILNRFAGLLANGVNDPVVLKKDNEIGVLPACYRWLTHRGTGVCGRAEAGFYRILSHASRRLTGSIKCSRPVGRAHVHVLCAYTHRKTE
jgi:hypothetical protein